jgi:SAM-dependent methyltransferase
MSPAELKGQHSQMIHIVKKTVRSICSRISAAADPLSPPDRECGPDWYDDIYRNVKSYHLHYSQSHYYCIWTVIADRIRRGGLRRVLEIGCGPGQLAALLTDQGVEQYFGLDFSLTAVTMARQNALKGRFIVGNALDPEIYAEVEYDVIICTEVLEHIQDDLQVVSRFAEGKRCLCTVPNFPYESHVRHFTGIDDVVARYGAFFERLDVSAWVSPKCRDDRFFLLDGVRSGGERGN